MMRWLFGLKPGCKKSYSEVINRRLICIIPAYNEELSIVATIRSIKKQSLKPDRIIVVDDCSTDRTSGLAKVEGVEVLRTNVNTGSKARAQNKAIFSLKNEPSTAIVITVDADTTLDKNCLKYYLEHFNKKDVVAVSGMVIPQKVDTFWEKVRFTQYLRFIYLNKGAQNHWGVPIVASGCAVAYLLGALRTHQGVPKDTITEDLDLTWRLLIDNKKVVIDDRAICYPIEPPNFKIYCKQVERWNRGFLQCISLHGVRLFINFKLGVFVYSYLLLDLLKPLAFTLFLFSLLNGLISYAVLVYIISLIFADMILGSTIITIRKRKYGRKSKVLNCFLYYLLVDLVNGYLFFKSVWKEWIMKDKLAFWIKGH